MDQQSPYKAGARFDAGFLQKVCRAMHRLRKSYNKSCSPSQFAGKSNEENLSVGLSRSGSTSVHLIQYNVKSLLLNHAVRSFLCSLYDRKVSSISDIARDRKNRIGYAE